MQFNFQLLKSITLSIIIMLLYTNINYYNTAFFLQKTHNNCMYLWKRSCILSRGYLYKMIQLTVSSICKTLSCSQASNPSIITTSLVWFWVKLSMVFAILAISSTSHFKTYKKKKQRRKKTITSLILKTDKNTYISFCRLLFVPKILQ